jgi:hypothetical protein
MNDQVEKIAKEWSLLIRANQMIPIYPPTQDLQVGDVFLVNTPIEDQAKIYNKGGFLPLDQMVVRLFADPKIKKSVLTEFDEFYNSMYGINGSVLPPKNWHDTDDGWKNAPVVSFPTYSFSIDSGAGLNLALPIESIPFALGLMKSGKYSATVVINDAHTYGLDNWRLEKFFRQWVDNHNSAIQTENSTKNGQTEDPNLTPEPNHDNNYFRIISRVYVAGGVNVTLTADETNGAKADAGEKTPIDLIGIKTDSSGDNYQTAINALNTLAKGSMGASVQVVTATNRSITLNETFKKPLVIGYIGFDIQFVRSPNKNSNAYRSIMLLNDPVPTLTRLKEKKKNTK